MASRWQIVVTMAVLLSALFSASGTEASARSSKSAKRAFSHSLSAKRPQRAAVAKKTRPTNLSKKSSKRTIKLAKKRSQKAKVASRTLLWSAPINTTPFTQTLRSRISSKFQAGLADRYSPEDMVRARVFVHQPLRGGIRIRKEPIKNLIIHSTETASVANAPRIIASWNKGGLSHPGTQYMVDRDGKIYQTADPRYATIHVNENRTRNGVTNDNSIGIEIVRTGGQQYTRVQLTSLVRLVDYIKDRYQISKMYGHGQIQPSNRTDPVAFNWSMFGRNLALLENSTRTQTAFNAPHNSSEG